MRKVLLMIAGFGMVAALAPLAANASHCASKVVIFNRPAAVNAAGLVCLGTPDTDDVDARLLYPGSTGVSLRYIVACTAGATLQAHLTGSLYPVPKDVAVTCTAAGTTYDSVTVTLPGSTTASATRVGCVTATIDDPDADTGTNVTTIHTVGATC